VLHGLDPPLSHSAPARRSGGWSRAFTASSRTAAGDRPTQRRRRSTHPLLPEIELQFPQCRGPRCEPSRRRPSCCRSSFRWQSGARRSAPRAGPAKAAKAARSPARAFRTCRSLSWFSAGTLSSHMYCSQRGQNGHEIWRFLQGDLEALVGNNGGQRLAAALSHAKQALTGKLGTAPMEGTRDRAPVAAPALVVPPVRQVSVSFAARHGAQLSRASASSGSPRDGGSAARGVGRFWSCVTNALEPPVRTAVSWRRRCRSPSRHRRPRLLPRREGASRPPPAPQASRLP
jgi:hypothetical protein